MFNFKVKYLRPSAHEFLHFTAGLVNILLCVAAGLVQHLKNHKYLIYYDM